MNNIDNGRNQGKCLVVYFSRSGNTREVAWTIAKITGADLFEIIPAKPYPSAFQDVLDQAKKEITAGFMPELKSDIGSVDPFDVIFIGSPNWWGTIAPPVSTFLSAHDLSGKTLVPFVTHEGSKMGHAEQDIKKLCPSAIVPEGLPVRGQKAQKAQKEVEMWLRKIGITT